MNDLSYDKAYKDLINIKSNLETDNRFYLDNEFQDHLAKIFHEKERTIDEGTIFYRARQITEDKITPVDINNPFKGFDAKNSFIPDNSWPASGRMNPQGIKVLYVASDEKTAVKELHPYYEELFSVASIRVNKQLKIADLSKSSSGLNDKYLSNLSVLIQEFISYGNKEKDYVFPQIIAAYCKHLGYDGIGYRSKYAVRDAVRHGSGMNLAVFNYDKCSAISSKIVIVGTVTVAMKDHPQN